MRKLFDILLIVAVVAFAGCKKTSYDDTIILLGEESYVVPLQNMIPDTLQSVFLNKFGDVPEGYIPANIEGEYKISAKEFCCSNYMNLSDNSDMYLKVTRQHNRVATVDLYECGQIKTDTAFVMGNGNLFTLYFNEDKIMVFNGNHVLVKRLVVFKGEKTDDGIKDLYFGNIILSTDNGNNPFLDPFASGYYFIYKDKDGLSENCNWF